jgi:hypothetical protein
MPAITDGYQSLTGANARWPNQAMADAVPLAFVR